jgi:hypothetical protein
MVFARRAAAAYVDDLRSALKDSGLPVTAPNVRLAFLVGPFAAARVLRTRPDQPLRRVLSAEAIAANPYMSGSTVAMLVRKAATDVSATAPARAGEPAAAAVDSGREPAGTPVVPEGEPTAATPTDVPFDIKCEIGLASCRKWIALREQKAQPLGRSAQQR